MRIIEINTLGNGAHRNQSGADILPDGWAVIPDAMELENFPFGEVTAEEVDGVLTVTAWVAGTIPDPEPTEEEPTTDERVTALEVQLAESDAVAMALYEAQAAQETVNAEQDEAIMGLYELIGG